MNSKKYQMDMCSGPLFVKILIFAIPLILSANLQLLFNAADMIVVGNYATTQAFAGIGVVAPVINLCVNLVMGISVGANVLVARFFGAGIKEDLKQAVNTSVIISVIMGCMVGLVAIVFSRPILVAMNTDAEVIEYSLLYIRIYFLGMPVAMLYNFGSAILRAVGDTRRPLIILTVAGVINVVLNLILVKYFNMSVAGVAIATIVSQFISALLVLRCLMTDDADYKVNIGELKLNWRMFGRMLAIGLPASIQSMLFSFSNILIQRSINEFGYVAAAGNTACSSIEGFVYASMNSVYQTNISFSSQNYGSGQIDRMKKSLFYCIGIVSVVGIVMGNLAYVFARPLLSIYIDDLEAIEYGVVRMSVIGTTYLLCGIMDVIVGTLRALGRSILPMIVSLIGVCGLRIIWIYTYFKTHHTLSVLYMSYPITWGITIIAHGLTVYIITRKLWKKKEEIIA